MLTVNKDAENTLIFTLTERSQLTSPNYLFSFTNDSTGEQVLFNMSDQSGYPRRFNEFVLIDTTASSCVYSLGLVPFSLTTFIDGNGDEKVKVTISTSEFPSTISSGTFEDVYYEVQQYQTETLIDSASGTVTAGNTLELTFDLVASSFIVSSTANYSDGAKNKLSLVYEYSGSPLSGVRVTSDGFTLPGTFSCGTASIEVINPRIENGPGFSIDPQYLNGELAQIETGAAFSGTYPYDVDADFDLYFSFGLDIDDWVDLPSSVNILTAASVSFKGYSGLNPSLGEVNLDYGFGKYEVYESVTQTLDIANTTGRILEEGKYFVTGYPASMDSNDTNTIYL